MAKTAILAVKVIGDALGASKALDQASTKADRMAKRMQSASRLATVGLAGLGAAAVSAARAAAQDQKSQALLAQTMSKNAGATKAQIAATEKWISAQSRAKGVADDELRPALGALVRATGSTAKAQGALKAAMDISAATGKPLETVSAAIAKGYAGQTGALKKLVPGIDEAALKSGDMSRIMADLAQKTGGAAATAANTAEGKFKRMQITMGELQESMGAALLPAMEKFAGVMATVAGFAERHPAAFQVLIGVLAATAATTIVVNAAYKAYTASTRIMTAVTKGAAIAQKVFNAAMRANPIGLVITAIALLVAGFILAYKKSDTFRRIVDTVGRAGKIALGWVVAKAQELWKKIQALGPAAKVAKDLFVGYFKFITTPIRKAIELIQDLVGWIKNIDFPSAPAWVSRLFGRGGAPAVATYASASRTAYSSLPGRGGPGGSGFLTSMGGSRGGTTLVNITVEGALDPEGVARQIGKLLRQQNIRLGGSY